MNNDIRAYSQTMREFNRIGGTKLYYIIILIILVAVSSIVQCDGPAKNYAVYGFCFEEDNSPCTADTEVTVYVDNPSYNISTMVVMVNLTAAMYDLNLGNLESGWDFGKNLTLILKRGNIVSITTEDIYPTGPNNQLINLTFKCPNEHEMFNHQCYHKYDLNHDGIMIRDYNDLMNAHKCFLGIEKNCRINYQNWQQIKKEYQFYFNQ